MVKKHILPVIVIAQFFCTSMWFAGNAVMPELVKHFALAPDSLTRTTIILQFGFISANLLFAFLTITDRFSPSKVFFISAVAGAFCNASIFFAGGINFILASRFTTGICLAGIYPVGMKLAADHYEKGLGKALGYLVGALVLGTAFPHLLRSLGSGYSWQLVFAATSVLSATGGLLIFLFVKNGPYRTPAAKLNIKAIPSAFKNNKYRAAAFGYFGHMWELYAFWAFLPVIITYYNSNGHGLNIPLWSFIIIASGSLACITGGYLSQRIGSARTAFVALALSFSCCLLSVLIPQMSETIFIIFMLVWGTSVVADSPQLSTLVAQNAQADTKGTALTIANAIGFSVTIISVQAIGILLTTISPTYVYLFLGIGPLLGLLSLKRLAIA